MESEARNACYKDQILIRVPKVRQKKSSIFCRAFGALIFFVNIFRRVPRYALHRLPSQVSRKGAKCRKVVLCVALRFCEKGKHFDRLSDLVQSSRLRASSPFALGIGAASFFRRSDSGGEKR